MAVKLTVEMTFWTEGTEDQQVNEAHEVLTNILRAEPGVDVDVTAEEYIEDEA